MFSEIFFSFLVSSIIACSLAVVRMLYKSKCQDVKCCGLEIKRNVALEEKADELELQMKGKVNNTESKNDILI